MLCFDRKQKESANRFTKEVKIMKKFVCLLMVAMMILALGITVYARYELCPDCEVALVNDSWTEQGQDFCESCKTEYDVREHY